jgi:hypothetical protein
MKNRRTLLALVLAAVVLAGCIGLFLVGLAGVSLFTITIQATSTPIPIDTPGPTPTGTSVPIPTHTPVPIPTKTTVPTPSDTPAPSNTPTPDSAGRVAPRVTQYSLEILSMGEELSRVRQDLGGLLQAPRLTQEDWKREVAAHVATLERIAQRLKDMNVPVEMIGVHSALLDANFDCEGARYFLEDVNNLSLSDVAVANGLVTSCSQKFSIHAQTLEP